MPGLGTLVNVLAIIGGGLMGLSFGKLFPERLQSSLQTSSGLMTIFIGLGGALQQMLKIENGLLTQTGTMMMIASLLLGTLIGELIDIDARLEDFGEWLKRKSGNEQDSAFTAAFVTASLTVCIGAMAIIGSIEDGIYANHSILFTKAILDFIILIALSASLGKGTIFSALPVGIFQGSVTLLARFIAPIMTDAAMANLSYIGNILILCVGVNLIWPRKFRVANMLPALLIAVTWTFIF